MRQIGVVSDAVVKGSQDAADWARVNTAVSVTADATIDGTRIQTRAAADALKRFTIRTSEDARSAIVEQHQMKLFWPIEVTRSARAGDHRRVDRQCLSRGGAGEQLQEHRQIDQPRYHFLDADQRDMHARACGG